MSGMLGPMTETQYRCPYCKAVVSYSQLRYEPDDEGEYTDDEPMTVTSPATGKEYTITGQSRAVSHTLTGCARCAGDTVH